MGKAGWGVIKQCGEADDLAVPIKLTAIYMLKVNKHTLRVKEVCQLVIDTATVLSGTTIAFANSERVGLTGCLTREERHSIAEIVRYFPRRAKFHLSKLGSEEMRGALTAETPLCSAKTAL